nr:hypothetical protein Iba_chr11cCG11910 [Ipomoea batatas]
MDLIGAAEDTLELLDLGHVEECDGIHGFCRQIILKQREGRDLEARVCATEGDKSAGYAVAGVYLEVQKALWENHDVPFVKLLHVYRILERGYESGTDCPLGDDEDLRPSGVRVERNDAVHRHVEPGDGQPEPVHAWELGVKARGHGGLDDPAGPGGIDRSATQKSKAWEEPKKRERIKRVWRNIVYSLFWKLCSKLGLWIGIEPVTSDRRVTAMLLDYKRIFRVPLPTYIV